MRVNIYGLRKDEDSLCTLVKERGVNYSGKNEFNSPYLIRDLMEDVFHLSQMPEEYVYLLCFGLQGKLHSVFEISHGAAAASVCNSREILIRALLSNASFMVLVHNHPSGVPTPSGDDQKTTTCIRDAARLIGIPLRDHLIIADESYYSFAENEPDLLGM